MQSFIACSFKKEWVVSCFYQQRSCATEMQFSNWCSKLRVSIYLDWKVWLLSNKSPEPWETVDGPLGQNKAMPVFQEKETVTDEHTLCVGVCYIYTLLYTLYSLYIFCILFGFQFTNYKLEQLTTGLVLPPTWEANNVEWPGAKKFQHCTAKQGLTASSSRMLKQDLW